MYVDTLTHAHTHTPGEGGGVVRRIRQTDKVSPDTDARVRAYRTDIIIIMEIQLVDAADNRNVRVYV